MVEGQTVTLPWRLPAQSTIDANKALDPIGLTLPSAPRVTRLGANTAIRPAGRALQTVTQYNRRMKAEELRAAAMEHPHHGRVRLAGWSQAGDGNWLAQLSCADCGWAVSGDYPPETFCQDLELWDIFLTA